MLVDSIWLNIGGRNYDSEDSTVTVWVTTATSLTASFTSSYGGGSKSISNARSDVGSWVKLTNITSSSDSRVYYMLSTKSEIKYNEVAFVDQNGKRIDAEVVYAGANPKETKPPRRKRSTSRINSTRQTFRTADMCAKRTREG